MTNVDDAIDIFPKYIRRTVKLILQDNYSGSVELAKKTAKCYIEFINNKDEIKSSEIIELINIFSRLVIKKHFAMASIFNLVNDILFVSNQIEDIVDIGNNIKDISYKYISKLDKSTVLISNQVKDIINNDVKILTHSNSQTIFNSLISLHSIGKKFSVVCTESRPINEGVTLAKKLGESGINVELIVDSAVFLYLDSIDLIFVGADAITKNGVINKIGTSILSLISKITDVDFYVLCSNDKILPLNFKYEFKNLQDPEEILSQKIMNVAPFNYYFDITPFSKHINFVTENGIFKSDKIIKIMSKKKIHPLLSEFF